MELSYVELPFKGDRQYIHGTELFNLMVPQTPTLPVMQIRFSIHGFVTHPACEVYASERKDDLSDVEDVRARCEFEIGGTRRWLAIRPRADVACSAKRYEYDEERILSLCALDQGRITLRSEAPYTFIENIVAMNKALHHRMFPDVAGKWVFTRIDMPVLRNEKKDLVLEFKHNMNYRLTKSDIFVSEEKIGELFFSLVK